MHLRWRPTRVVSTVRSGCGTNEYDIPRAFGRSPERTVQLRGWRRASRESLRGVPPPSRLNCSVTVSASRIRANGTSPWRKPISSVAAVTSASGRCTPSRAARGGADSGAAERDTVSGASEARGWLLSHDAARSRQANARAGAVGIARVRRGAIRQGRGFNGLRGPLRSGHETARGPCQPFP